MNRKRIRRVGNFGGGELPAFLRAVLLLSEAEGYPPEVIVAKAKEALKISEDCYTAYLIFAENAGSHEDRIKWARQALEATRRLDQNPEYTAFNTLELSLHDNYVAVKNLLTQYLCEAGKWEEAVPLLQELVYGEDGYREADLRLLFALLITGNFAEADKLCEKCSEPMEDWFFGAALIQFGLHGDSELSRRALTIAIDDNPLVPDYLTGRKSISFKPLSDIQQDAEDFVADFWQAWLKTPGAINWLEERTQIKLTLLR